MYKLKIILLKFHNSYLFLLGMNRSTYLRYFYSSLFFFNLKENLFSVIIYAFCLTSYLPLFFLLNPKDVELITSFGSPFFILLLALAELFLILSTNLKLNNPQVPFDFFNGIWSNATSHDNFKDIK